MYSFIILMEFFSVYDTIERIIHLIKYITESIIKTERSYFIAPEGLLLALPHTHIAAVFERPHCFRLSREEIGTIIDNTDVAHSRERVLGAVFAKGYIRIRFETDHVEIEYDASIDQRALLSRCAKTIALPRPNGFNRPLSYRAFCITHEPEQRFEHPIASLMNDDSIEPLPIIPFASYEPNT